MTNRFTMNSSAASACACTSFSCASFRLITDAVLASVSVITVIPSLRIKNEYNHIKSGVSE